MLRHVRNLSTAGWIAWGLPVLCLAIVLGCGSKKKPGEEDLKPSAKNLRIMHLATLNYLDTNIALPLSIFTEDGKPHHSWQAMLLPFIDHRYVYSQIDFNQPWNAAANKSPMSVVVKFYVQPGDSPQRNDSGLGLSHFAANSYLMQNNPDGSRIHMRDINTNDGTQHTMLYGEVAAGFKPWGDPTNFRDPGKGLNKGPDTFGRPGGKGALFVFADGSVRYLSNDTDPKILKAIGTIRGGEEVPAAEKTIKVDD